ncbi:hypothetical protein FHS35_008856 [Streptomyces umbrinus]|nr:hypothetical protein [Streptomyces umbrinus]
MATYVELVHGTKMIGRQRMPARVRAIEGLVAEA